MLLISLSRNDVFIETFFGQRVAQNLWKIKNGKSGTKADATFTLFTSDRSTQKKVKIDVNLMPNNGFMYQLR